MMRTSTISWSIVEPTPFATEHCTEQKQQARRRERRRPAVGMRAAELSEATRPGWLSRTCEHRARRSDGHPTRTLPPLRGARLGIELFLPRRRPVAEAFNVDW